MVDVYRGSPVYFIDPATGVYNGAPVYLIDPTTGLPVAQGGNISDFTVLGPDATTALTLSELSGAHGLNVKMFGATGDGLTNDTAACQAAIDAAEAAPFFGRVVYFPAGDYYLPTGLKVMAHGVQLVGAGRTNTRLSLGGITINGVDLIYIGATGSLNTLGLPNGFQDGNAVRHMTLQTNFASPAVSGGAVISNRGIVLDRTRGCVLDDLYIIGFYGGVVFAGTGETNFLMNSDIVAGAAWTAVPALSYAVSIRRRKVPGPKTDTVNGDPNAEEDANEPGVYYTEPNSTYLSNLNLKGQGNFPLAYGLEIKSADGVYIKNIHVNLVDKALIRLVNEQASNAINGVQADGVYLDGVIPEGDVTASTDFGIIYENNAALTSNLHLNHLWNNVRIDQTSLAAIQINTDGQNIRFTNLEARLNLKYALQLVKGKRIQISNFTFHDSNQGGGSDAHVLLQGGEDVEFSDGFMWSTVAGSGGHRGFQCNAGTTLPGLRIKGCHIEGTATIGSTTDPYFIRGGTQRYIRGNTSDRARTVASASSVILPEELEEIEITGTTTINTFHADTSFEWRRVTIKFASALTLGHATGNIQLPGAVNKAVAAGDVYSFVFDGTNWRIVQ